MYKVLIDTLFLIFSFFFIRKGSSFLINRSRNFHKKHKTTLADKDKLFNFFQFFFYILSWGTIILIFIIWVKFLYS